MILLQHEREMVVQGLKGANLEANVFERVCYLWWGFEELFTLSIQLDRYHVITHACDLFV